MVHDGAMLIVLLIDQATERLAYDDSVEDDSVDKQDDESETSPIEPGTRHRGTGSWTMSAISVNQRVSSCETTAITQTVWKNRSRPSYNPRMPSTCAYRCIPPREDA